MARLSLSQSPKFKVLVRSLKIPTPYVRGYLELLWESAHFRDDPYFDSLDEVEASSDWQGDVGLLGTTLLERGWIDQHGEGFAIHDYEEHLPSYVKERRKKADYRKSQRGQVKHKDQGQSGDSHGTIQGQSGDNISKRNGMEWNGMEGKGIITPNESVEDTTLSRSPSKPSNQKPSKPKRTPEQARGVNRLIGLEDEANKTIDRFFECIAYWPKNSFVRFDRSAQMNSLRILVNRQADRRDGSKTDPAQTLRNVYTIAALLRRDVFWSGNCHSIAKLLRPSKDNGAIYYYDILLAQANQ